MYEPLTTDDLPYQPTHTHTHLPATWAWAFDAAARCVDADAVRNTIPDQPAAPAAAPTAAWGAMRAAVSCAQGCTAPADDVPVCKEDASVQQLVELLRGSPEVLGAMQALFASHQQRGASSEAGSWRGQQGRCTPVALSAIPRAAVAV